MIVELNITIPDTVLLEPEAVSVFYTNGAALRRQDTAVEGRRFTVLIARFEERNEQTVAELCALLCIVFQVPYVAVTIPQLRYGGNIDDHARDVGGFEPERFIPYLPGGERDDRADALAYLFAVAAAPHAKNKLH